MIAAHRFEIAPPPPAIDLAGKNLDVDLDDLDRATGPRGNDPFGGGLASGTGLHACAIQKPADESIPQYGSRLGNIRGIAPQKLESIRLCAREPTSLNDPTGRDENLAFPQIAVVTNNTSQQVWIGFDADQMGSSGTNLDVRIPLAPGESSASFTPDADAILVAPGQTIDGKSDGAFKVRFGTFTLTEAKDGKIQMSTPLGYKIDPTIGHNKNPPAQWKLTGTDLKTREEKAELKKKLKETLAEREKRIRDRENQ